MSVLVFDSEKGNELSITLLDVVNKVSSIAVKDDQDKAVKYGTKINSDQEYTYYVTKFAKTETDEDLDSVKWVFWLNKTQDKLSEKSFPIDATAEKEDQEENYLLTNDDAAKDYTSIKDNGIISAVLESAEVTIDGKKKKTAVLKVKFSKWLDGELIKVEAAIDDTFTLSSNNDSVASRELLAKPEIVEVYWTTKDGERIEKTGYSEEITMHLVTLGLKEKTLEVQTYEQDHDSQERMSEGDQISWENNSFKIEGREFERQFKVGSKESHKTEREEDVANDNPPFSSFFDFAKREPREEGNEDLELSIDVINAEALKLDTSKTYGSLILTPKEVIVDAYFAKIDKESMALDAPLNKGANKKGKVDKHEKLTEAVIGQKINLVAECDNINDKEVVFQIFEKEKVLVEADTALKVVDNGTELTEVVAKVEDGYAVIEIKLRPKSDADFKTWRTTLKFDEKAADRNETKLYIKVKEKDSPLEQEFLKDDGLKVVSSTWVEPVSNPISTNYTQSGTSVESYSKHWGLFGTTRNGKKHSGLDLFATTGTDIVACVDATVVRARWHGGYGNTMTLKVSDPAAFVAMKRDYTLEHPNEGEIKKDSSYSENGNFYLFYAHLDSVKVFKKGDEVKAGDKLGETGRSGVTAGTRAPHLHFEIKSIEGLGSRINPAFYSNYKYYDDQSQTEKDSQKTENERGKIKEVNGSKQLSTTNFKFV